MISAIAGVILGTAAATASLALLGLTDVPAWRAALAGALLGAGVVGWALAAWRGR